MGKGAAYTGSMFVGFALYGTYYNSPYIASSGVSDANGVWYTGEYQKDIWHTFAMKYDGTNFSYFVDKNKVGTSKGSSPKISKLYVGGTSNSGTSSSGCYWGYGNGYYRNLAIYDGALSDEELSNYSF